MSRIIPKGAALSRVEIFLRKVYSRRITADDDAVIAIIGGEGSGKSTFILQVLLLWNAIKNESEFGEVDHEELFKRIYSTRSGFQQAFVNAEQQSAIALPDAARALFSKEGMVGEQRELEKDFYDVRFQQFLMLLGFQDWEQLPSFLSGRRAQFGFFIPRTGVIWGYSRSSLDEREENDGRGVGSWPEPDMKDRFPSLEGTDLWSKYQQYDADQKIARMGGNEEASPEQVQRAEKIKAAIRLVEEFDFNQTDAGRAVGRSQGWVSDRMGEWELGDHDDLFDNPPKKTAVQR